jgi:hypothetical protein
VGQATWRSNSLQEPGEGKERRQKRVDMERNNERGDEETKKSKQKHLIN